MSLLKELPLRVQWWFLGISALFWLVNIGTIPVLGLLPDLPSALVLGWGLLSIFVPVPLAYLAVRFAWVGRHTRTANSATYWWGVVYGFLPLIASLLVAVLLWGYGWYIAS